MRPVTCGFLSIIIIFTMSIPALAGESPLSLTLEDCISRGLQNNPGIQSINRMVDSSRLDYDVSLAAFDPILSANIFDSITRRGGISLESQIAGGSKSSYLSGDFEIRKTLFTGSQWALKFETGRSETESVLSEGSLATYEGKTTLSFTKPLLEGAGPEINKLGLKYAEINLSREQLGKDDTVRELVHNLKSTYYSALEAARNVDVANISLEEAKTLFESAKAQRKAGRLSDYDVMAAESGLASREEALLLAETEYSNVLDSLKNLMGMEIDIEIELTDELVPIQFDIPDFEIAYDLAISHRPDLKRLQKSIKSAELDKKLRKNQLKPTLALIGQAGLQGEDLEWGGAIDDMNNLSWYLGMNYTVPLGNNREAKARMSQSDLQLEAATIGYEDKLSQIKLEITRALRNIRASEERLVVTLKGVKVQEEKLAMEKARLNLGLITSGQLLDFEEDLASARLNHIKAIAGYMKTFAYLEYVTNTELAK